MYYQRTAITLIHERIMKIAGCAVMRLAAISMVAFVTAGVLTVDAQDWTQWRGPNRDGVVKDFSAPTTWPKELVNKWKVAVGGGYSSPVVSGSKIYLHTREGKTGWSVRQVWQNPKVAMYLSSPVLDGKYLYGMSSLRKGQYFCINVETGELLWATDGRAGRNASVLGAGNVLMFLTEDAELIVANKSPKGFESIARYTVGDAATWAHLVVFGKNILVKDKAALRLISIE